MNQPNRKTVRIDWQPQPRQLLAIKACGLSLPFDKTPLHKAVADIIGYGGAAGGGKTDTLLSIATLIATNYPGANIGYFRREFPQLEGAGGAIMRSRAFLSNFCKYNEQKKRWTFPSKKDNHGKAATSILQFNHCKDPSDVYNYLSNQFDVLLIDEATQFEKDMVKLLLTRNRANVDYPTFQPFAVLATNPGQVGHQYFKDEFVTLGEPEIVNTFINESGDPERHLFIPSKLADNQILEKRDPNYRKRLGATEMNRRVYLDGDWDVFAGQAFPELNREIHLIDPFDIPAHWTRFAAYDYGYNHPFSFGVFVVDDDGNVYLAGYASSRLKKPHEMAALMVSACQGIGGISTLRYIVAGHDCWNRGRDGGPSIAELFYNLPKYYPSFNLPTINLTKANIARVAGASQLREYISYKDKVIENGQTIDGKPRFYIFKPYQTVYDTLARMIFDTNGPNPEDVLKVDADENGYGGDDDYDMTRYGLMSRPSIGKRATRVAPQNSVMGYIKKKEEERYLKQEYVGW
jgi:phage terminase large subunit